MHNLDQGFPTWS